MSWWFLTSKDLRLQIRDRRALAVLLVLPLIFISIIGLSTGKLLGWRAANQVVKVAWVDLDGSDFATRLRNKLNERSEIEVLSYSDNTAAKQDVFDGKCTLAMTIGTEFQARINAVELRDFFARRSNQGRLAAGLSSLDISVETKPSWSWVSQLVSDTLFSMAMEEMFSIAAGKDKFGRAFIDSMDAAVSPPASVQATIADGKTTKNAIYDTLVPGFTVMFTFFLVNVMARSFIAERDIGTLRRLRLAPITPSGLLIGKTLPFLVISLLQCLALFVFGKLLFDMSWGERPWLLLPIILSTSLAATSLGLLVATSVRTDSQVSSYSNLIVISCAGISGCFLPRDWMPELMRQLSLCTPHAWSLIAYGEALSNPLPAFAPVAQGCAVLLAFSALFFTAGWWRFRGMC